MEKVGFSEGHAFILDLLDPSAVCLDLGANRGNFASFIEKNTPARVISVEPVSDLFDALPSNSRRSKIKAIVAAERGEATINIYSNCCPSVLDIPAGGESRQESVVCHTLSDIFDAAPAGEIALVKMDIEGPEVDVLRTTEPDVLRRAAQFTVEFHDFVKPSMRPAVEATMRHMKSVGFAVIRFSMDNTNVLFVRRDRLRYGLLSHLWLAGPVKYLAGLTRIVSRKFRPEQADRVLA